MSEGVSTTVLRVALPAGLLAGLLWDIHPLYTFATGALLSFAAMAMLRVIHPIVTVANCLFKS